MKRNQFTFLSKEKGQGALPAISVLVAIGILITVVVAGTSRGITQTDLSSNLTGQVENWDTRQDAGYSSLDFGDVTFSQPDNEEIDDINETLDQVHGKPREETEEEGRWINWVKGIGYISDGLYKWIFEGPIDDIVAGNVKHLPKWAKGITPRFAKFAKGATRVLSIAGGVIGLWLLSQKVKNFSMDRMRSMSVKEQLVYWLEVIADGAAVVAGAATIVGLVLSWTGVGGAAGFSVAATASTIALVAGSLALLVDIFWPE